MLIHSDRIRSIVMLIISIGVNMGRISSKLQFLKKSGLCVNSLECMSTGVFLYSFHLIDLKELVNGEHQNT